MTGRSAVRFRRLSELAAGRVLARLGILDSIFRLRERVRASRTGPVPEVGWDGLTLPPPRLQVLVTGRASADFESWSRDAGESVRELVAATGPPLERLGSVLEFCVGCGRVARNWST